ncbi:MAG: hypothetical protein VW405_22415, partial [Rhodospirillaceae bacterium]
AKSEPEPAPEPAAAAAPAETEAPRPAPTLQFTARRPKRDARTPSVVDPKAMLRPSTPDTDGDPVAERQPDPAPEPPSPTPAPTPEPTPSPAPSADAEMAQNLADVRILLGDERPEDV